MYVPVEHRYRVEAAQRRQDARAVFSGPAPRRKERVERNVSEDDDWGRAFLRGEIFLDEIDLLGPKLPVDFEVEDVDERQEMCAALVPRKPSLRRIASPKGLEECVGRTDDVMLAGQNDERSLERPEYLLRRIELCGLGQMRDRKS